MPRRDYTIDTVIKMATYPGLEDIQTLLDCHAQNDPERLKIQTDLDAATDLTNAKTKWAKMTDANKQTIQNLLSHAESYEASLADSLKGTKDYKAEYKEALAKADTFKFYRHKFFGKNKLEVFMENSVRLTLTGHGLVYDDGTPYVGPTINSQEAQEE